MMQKSAKVMGWVMGAAICGTAAAQVDPPDVGFPCFCPVTLVSNSFECGGRCQSTGDNGGVPIADVEDGATKVGPNGRGSCSDRFCQETGFSNFFNNGDEESAVNGPNGRSGPPIPPIVSCHCGGSLEVDLGHGLAGVWACNASGPVTPDASITLTLSHDKHSRVAVFDLKHINEDLLVTRKQGLAAPGDLTGTVTFWVGDGPAEATPVTLTALNFTLGAVTLSGRPTGQNTIELSPGVEGVAGIYDAEEGTVHFDTAVRALLFNDAFPSGLPVSLTPILVVGGDQCRVYPMATIAMPEE